VEVARPAPGKHGGTAESLAAFSMCAGNEQDDGYDNQLSDIAIP
jgi:hypothetical protein